MEEKQALRENWIDAAKAIAILIVVLNHSGLNIPGVNFWGGIFYVPIFFLLSGYTYHPTEENFKSFAKKKERRLLVPYLMANGILYGIFTVKTLIFNPGTGDILDFVGSWVILCRNFIGVAYGRSYAFRLTYSDGQVDMSEPLMTFLNGPTWFLPALFLVLICADGIYRRTKGKTKKICIILSLWLLIMLPHYYLGFVFFPWSLDILPILLVFFYTGYYLNSKAVFVKIEEGIGFKKWGIIAGILLIGILASLINGSYNLSLNDMGKSVLLCIVAAVSLSCLVLLILRWLQKMLPQVVKVLGSLGKHTLTILCFHYFVMQMFFTAASAALGAEWRNNGVSNTLVCLTGIVLSITACVCLDLIVNKVKAGYKKHRRNSG